MFGAMIPGMFSAATVGTQTGAAAASAGGLFSASNLFAGAMGAQAGMGLYNAFGGGGSMGSFAPTSAIRLTKRGQQLEKNVFGKIKSQYETGSMTTENLATKYVHDYVGKMKRLMGQQAKLAESALMGTATKRVRTGRGAMGMLGAGMARMKGLAEPERARENIRTENFHNALANLQNIMAIEKQVPILRAQSSFARSGLGNLRSAAQGQAVGDILNFMGYINRPRG